MATVKIAFTKIRQLRKKAIKLIDYLLVSALVLHHSGATKWRQEYHAAP
jgi:hypothetical protein